MKRIKLFIAENKHDTDLRYILEDIQDNHKAHLCRIGGKFIRGYWINYKRMYHSAHFKWSKTILEIHE